MSDGRANNGGARKGAGRKPKAQEIKLIESLDRFIDPDKASKKLKDLIEDDNFNALKLYFEYRFGKPKEKIDLTVEEFDIKSILKFGRTKS